MLSLQRKKRKDETIKREILGKSLAIQRLSLIRRKRRIAEIGDEEMIIIQKPKFLGA
jgi:hypothetical protein